MIAVTGAAGFIGAALCAREAVRGRPVRSFVHRPAPAGGDDAVAFDLGCANVDELARRLDGVTAIVHLAGRANGADEAAADAEAGYRRANVDATERLARAALAAGVRRFILASTVKVNGEATAAGRPFRPDDAPAPRSAYARSKLGAERALARIAAGTPMAPIVLRLPLVYGPGAGGNFRRLVDAIAARRWLPLGAVDNRRSLLGLANLLDALDAALAAPPGLAGTHFVADADSVSTPALVRAIAAALRVAPRLVPVPLAALRLAGALSGQGAAIARLTQSLEVDTASFSTATRWRPRAFAIEAATLAGHGGPRHIIAVHE
ncbi:MAG TPA: NAD-dependent epimerase/dehydratase family protein [Casimicrobiaceae bacterium]